MEIAPEGVLDPSAHLYDTTLYSMAGILALAVACNALIRPVHPRHHLPSEGEVGGGVGVEGGSSLGGGGRGERAYSTSVVPVRKSLPMMVKETDPFFEPVYPRERKWGPFD